MSVSSLKDDCSVCLSPLVGRASGTNELQMVVCTPCGHKFHDNCLRGWYGRGQPGNCCPLCRHQMNLSDALPIALPPNPQVCLERFVWGTLAVLFCLMIFFFVVAGVAEMLGFECYNELELAAWAMEILMFAILGGYFAWVYCSSENLQENKSSLAMAFILAGVTIWLSCFVAWKYLQQVDQQEKANKQRL